MRTEIECLQDTIDAYLARRIDAQKHGDLWAVQLCNRNIRDVQLTICHLRDL